MDEMYLSSSLLRMNYADLATQPLDYQQKAPIGFLWLAKLAINQFGNSEFALRLIPLTAGIVSLFLYRRVCSYFLKPWGQVVAMVIFSMSPAIIYHDTEIKQYAVECFTTVISLYFFIKYKDKEQWNDKIIWGILGAVLLWFSYSAIFILAGIGAGMSLYAITQKNWKIFSVNLVPFSIWVISFLVNYLLFTHKHAESQWIVYWFKVYNNFMPFPPHSIEEFKWFPRNFYQLLDYPLGLVWNPATVQPIVKILTIPLVPSVLLFTGITILFKINKRDFYILMFPVLLMLTASGLYLYPLLERFWVFIAPVFILFIAIAFDYYQNKFSSSKLIWIMFFLTVSSPVSQSIYFLAWPEMFYKHKKSYERESFLYIKDHFKAGDAVYNYWNNAPGYTVYKKIIPFNFKITEGKDFRKVSENLAAYNQNLQTDFNRFTGKQRVWVIFNTQIMLNIGDQIDEPRWYYKNILTPPRNLLNELSKIGKPIEKIVHPDISVYLFEIN